MKKTIYPKNTTSLREALIAEGFNFPCGGKGLCGRCRILAPSLQVTNLDRRFLTENDIQKGIRLACDKTFDEPIEIEATFGESIPKRKLQDAVVTAVICEEVTEISIIEDDVVETITLPSAYPETIDIRSLIGKNSIELYEKYGVAKAGTMLVAGTIPNMQAFCGKTMQSGDSYDASLFDMPAEEVYLAPMGENVGSDILLELAEREEGTLLIKTYKDSVVFAHNGTETVLVSSLRNDVPELYYKAIKSAYDYYKEKTEITKTELIGSDIHNVKNMISGAVVAESNIVQSAKRAILENRFKTKLLKLARKSYCLTLADDERFQEILNNRCR